MDNLAEKFRELPAGSFPETLPVSTMRLALVARYRKLLLATLAVLCWNLAMTAWGTWERMIQLDTLSALRETFVAFSLDGASLAELADIVTDFLPLRSLAIGAINLASVASLVYLLQQWKLFRFGRAAL